MPDADGLAACAMHADGLDGVSRERIGMELTRIIVGPNAAPTIGAMEQSGVLARILPGASVATLARLIDLEDQLSGGFEWVDVALLRWASLLQHLDPESVQLAETGSNASFPIAAADLMPAYSGRALGDRLKTLEAEWIASQFRKTKSELLALP